MLKMFSFLHKINNFIIKSTNVKQIILKIFYYISCSYDKISLSIPLKFMRFMINKN